LGIRGFIGLASADLDGQRQPGAVRHQVEFGAPAASTTPQGVILRLVR
jgi:hypothetical protein